MSGRLRRETVNDRKPPTALSLLTTSMDTSSTPRPSLVSLTFDVLLAIFRELDTRDVVRIGMVKHWSPSCFPVAASLIHALGRRAETSMNSQKNVESGGTKPRIGTRETLCSSSQHLGWIPHLLTT